MEIKDPYKNDIPDWCPLSNWPVDIPSLKRYITMTYKMFGDKKYSSYWNSGYINALKNHKIITAKEVRILSKHNLEKEYSK